MPPKTNAIQGTKRGTEIGTFLNQVLIFPLAPFHRLLPPRRRKHLNASNNVKAVFREKNLSLWFSVSLSLTIWSMQTLPIVNRRPNYLLSIVTATKRLLATIDRCQTLVVHRASLASAAVWASHKWNPPPIHLSRFLRPAIVRGRNIFPAMISYFLPFLARSQNPTNRTKGEKVCLTATMEQANAFHRSNTQHNAFISGKQKACIPLSPPIPIFPLLSQTAIHISAFTYTDNVTKQGPAEQKRRPIKHVRKWDPEAQQALYSKIINRLTLTSYYSRGLTGPPAALLRNWHRDPK